MFKTNRRYSEGAEDIEDEDLENEEQSFGDKWKWMDIIEKLAKGDITKFNEVSKQNLISCFNLLSYWKERDDLLEEMRKAKQKK